jgi:D-apiose dehydrogenase
LGRAYPVSAKLRGVAVGSGYFSQFHYDAWNRIEGVSLSALCGRDPRSLEEMAQRHGVGKTYGDVAAMLDAERPDFIDIITPPETHASIVAMAADRGVAVLCQKALAPSFAEAKALVTRAESAGIRLMVHDNFRFQPWHREMRRLLDHGLIGNLQSIGCRTRLGDGWGDDAYLSRQPYFRDMPRLLVFETGVHFIDVFRYLGGEITAAFARLRRLNPVIAGEDRALVLCELASGATAMWDADRYHRSAARDARYTFGEFLLEGSKGGLRLDEDGGLVFLPLTGPPVDLRYEHTTRGFAGDCVFATISHFVDRLRSGQPFELEGRDYLHTMAVQEAVYRSASTGRLEPVTS